MKNGLLFLILMSCLAPAVADQAAYVSKANAMEAVAVINKTKIIKKFCAPCEDTAALEVAVRRVEAVDADYKNFWEVKVNDRGIDLAYTYISEDKRWRNLAIILDLPVVDVPEFIP